MDEIPERDNGRPGEPMGATLARALGNASRYEGEGGAVTGCIVVATVQMPGQAGEVIMVDATPQMPKHTRLGLLTVAGDDIRAMVQHSRLQQLADDEES